MVLQVDSQPVKKRKQPPTFHHYPIDRAKKLKQVWVETAKIKSKWKAEKRKQSKTQPTSTADQEVDQNESEDESQSEVLRTTQSITEEQHHDPSPSPSPPPPPPSRGSKKPNSERPIASLPSSRKDRKAFFQQKREPNKPTEPISTLTLRDLEKEAYSRSSLHNYKSDPLKRKRGAANRGRGKQSGPAVHASATPRGQPNMKLRMDAMLERIKQTMT